MIFGRKETVWVAMKTKGHEFDREVCCTRSPTSWLLTGESGVHTRGACDYSGALWRGKDIGMGSADPDRDPRVPTSW